MLVSCFYSMVKEQYVKSMMYIATKGEYLPLPFVTMSSHED
jgi:hypothetical protein